MLHDGVQNAGDEVHAQRARADIETGDRRTIAAILALSLEPSQAIRRWEDARSALAALGMTGSDWVNVTFLWLETPHLEAAPPPLDYEDIPTVYWDERPPLDDFVAPIEDGRYSYVPETGHNVPVRMLEFWYATGGWWIHGLPVSEFFREIQADGTERFVQYYERSVLSMDLSGATSPPRVSADNLGYNTYIDPEARKPIPVFEPNPHFIFFPETGHTVAHGFKALFESRGGVEVFGYPLSEEWSTVRPDGRKVVYQVFERARFEWWPDRVGHGDEVTLEELAEARERDVDGDREEQQREDLGLHPLRGSSPR